MKQEIELSDKVINAVNLLNEMEQIYMKIANFCVENDIKGQPGQPPMITLSNWYATEVIKQIKIG